MKGKNHGNVDAESDCREPAVGDPFPAPYLERITSLIRLHTSIDTAALAPLFLLIAPGINAGNLLATVFNRLQCSFRAFDCMANVDPEIERGCRDLEAGYILVSHPENLSAEAAGMLLSLACSSTEKKFVIATTRPLWVAGANAGKIDCEVLGHRELRYNGEELQYLLDQLCLPEHRRGDGSPHFDRHDLFQLTQGWPVISECAIADIRQASLGIGGQLDSGRLQFFPLAHLDSVNQHFISCWLPLLANHYNWLIEICTLPLLNLDLLVFLFDDLGTSVEECLIMGWLEPCPKNVGCYQINLTIDVLLLSIYPQFRNEDVLDRAAHWYRRHGYLAEAVECWVSFVDKDQVLTILADTDLPQSGKSGSEPIPHYRIRVLEALGAAAEAARGSMELATGNHKTQRAKVIVTQAAKSIAGCNRPSGQGRQATADIARGDVKRSVANLSNNVGVVEHIVRAFGYHQKDNPEAVSLAIAAALDAGIDRQNLSAVIDFMDLHIRPLLRNQGNPLQLALRDIKHSAPAREAVAAQQQQLNHRELQVLQRICEGYKNREISEQLGLELSTIKWYSTGIYEKLQVRNRTQAVAKAQALKLFD